jgi:hypothetical protein
MRLPSPEPSPAGEGATARIGVGDIPLPRHVPGRPAVAILGKVQRILRDPSQLDARIATAAALWHAAPAPKPWILYVASDVHGRDRRPDGLVVRRMLVRFGVAAEDFVFRPWSNCTVVEARALRVLARALRLGAITALTHPYHAPRARRILTAVIPGIEVLAVRPEAVTDLTVPGLDLQRVVALSMPGRADLVRERTVESVLAWLGIVDRRGRFERKLASALRAAAPRRTHRRAAGSSVDTP